MAKEKKKRKKGARKKFFEVLIPLTASKAHLYHYSEEELNGSIIKLDLTKNLKGKNMEMRAKVKYEDKKLTSEILSLKLVSSYIKKVMRRGTDYIEDSFPVNSKDCKLRIKPFMITRKRVSRKMRGLIRNASKKFIESHAKIRVSKELFSEVMTNKLQKALSLKIKKLYPLALCEIRIIEIIGPADKVEKSNPEKISNKGSSKKEKDAESEAEEELESQEEAEEELDKTNTEEEEEIESEIEPEENPEIQDEEMQS